MVTFGFQGSAWKFTVGLDDGRGAFSECRITSLERGFSLDMTVFASASLCLK
jgi:hypothetical protein